MKIRRLWNVLLLCSIGVVFVMHSSFVETKTEEGHLSSSTLLPIDQGKVFKVVDTIIIKNMVFTPSELHVRKGETVLWINNDIVAHNVTDFPEDKWTSGTLARHGAWEMKIDETFDYYCSIHPTMKGKIIVDP
ncbi:plastocyanin/azurin family copper-binding protein [Gelidibacter gilvus]|uniref:Blue (type 1) copper domain-containing protein n=1 Tax=Gelidibacter gilvus TaxID=59602 RepID=A0A4Q0XIJ7_9FLAO|nr:plastocyanin/azurin family copper-binding protein [Gelidibacter gilvus]RXJ49964.1 hypothetical protein ESZ48_11000 [Gelidibacter gilvus]